MSVLIGRKYHTPFQPDRAGESGYFITACGLVTSNKWDEAPVDCAKCLVADRTMVDPERVPIPKLRFGFPETATDLVAALKLKKAAQKKITGFAQRGKELAADIRNVQLWIKQGVLANRCPCGKFPWEHSMADKCGARNPYRRAKLRRLYLKMPARSLEGSNQLARMASK